VPKPAPHRLRANKAGGEAEETRHILFACETARGRRSGVWWIDVDPFADDPRPVYHDIGGPRGVTFDLIELADLNGNGDLDLITCDDRDQTGVIWYENSSL
jgi:hypothetical protein